MLNLVEIKITAADGISEPDKFILAGRSNEYKAVVTPTLEGTYAWSTPSERISLVNTSSPTVTVIATNMASIAVDAEELRAGFRVGGSGEEIAGTHNLTVVKLDWLKVSDAGDAGNYVTATNADEVLFFIGEENSNAVIEIQVQANPYDARVYGRVLFAVEGESADPATGSFAADFDPEIVLTPTSGNREYLVKAGFDVNGDAALNADEVQFKARVKVVKVDLEIYKPKVIDPAEPMIPDASEMTTGSVTFVNLDNDDNDGKFDNVDDVVTNGDNELVKIKLNIQPNNLTNGTVKLLATAGAGNIAVWTNGNKSSSSAYTLGTSLNLPADFTVEGDNLVKTLWVEGIAAHTVQKGTTLEMEYTAGTLVCGDEAALTVVGVDQVVWQGKTNSVSDTSTLDADPNWTNGLTPNSIRVFPDARVVGGTVEASPRDKVGVEVTLTVEPPSEIKVYLDSFDVDDPTAATNVVDNETAERDNRGTSPAQDGQFVGESGGVKELVFPANVKTTNCEFQVTMQPGDNFRVVANGDKDFVMNLENDDTFQNVGEGELERNINKQLIMHKYVTGLPEDRKIRESDHYASDTLTVWRFLHVEVDSMAAPPIAGAEKNTVGGNITGVTGNGIVAQAVTLNVNLRTGLTPQDNSVNLNSSPAGNGRFENGEIIIGTGAGTPGETTTTGLLGNGDDYVLKDSGIDIPAQVTKTGESDVDGKVIAWSGSTFTLNVSSGTLSANYDGGTLNVAGVTMTISIVNTNGGVNTVTVTATVNIPFVLHDDDITEDVPDPDIGGMEPIWKDAYVKPIFDTGYNTPNASFHLNTPREWFTSHASESRGSLSNSVSHYWVVLVKCGYQTDPFKDNDADAEGTWRGGALGENVLLLEESIRDWIATPTNSSAGGGGSIDPDTNGDAGRQPRRQEILNHEVGHLFGLKHEDGLPVPAGRPNGDVMLPSWGRPGQIRQASVFGLTSLDKIRSAPKPK